MISAIFLYRRNAIPAFINWQCNAPLLAQPVPKVAFINSAIATGSIDNNLPDVVNVWQESYLQAVLIL